MWRDLRRSVDVWRKTVGTFDYPEGRSVRLRTGRALAKRGLVELGNGGSANAYRAWRPTPKGRDWIVWADTFDKSLAPEDDAGER